MSVGNPKFKEACLWVSNRIVDCRRGSWNLTLGEGFWLAFVQALGVGELSGNGFFVPVEYLDYKAQYSLPEMEMIFWGMKSRVLGSIVRC